MSGHSTVRGLGVPPSLAIRTVFIPRATVFEGEVDAPREVFVRTPGLVLVEHGVESQGVAYGLSIKQLVDIAAVTHEANRRWCTQHGDTSQPTWEDAPDWQRKSAIVGVFKIAAGMVLDIGASHESWLKEKVADGWTYGHVKDPEKKEHPCMVPFDALPLEQQAKDYLFVGIVRGLLAAVQKIEAR